MILAGHTPQPSTAEQIALMCMITGGLVWLYWLARGAAYVLIGAALVALAVVAGATYAVEWLIEAAWRAHMRGVARVRALESGARGGAAR